MIWVFSSSFMVFLSGVTLYSFWRKHLLISLLSLEYMVLGVLLLFHVSYLNYGFIFSLVYLTFTACEGALGLSILVSMSRSHGSDYFSSFHLFCCI